jgi:hypothetical protein
MTQWYRKAASVWRHALTRCPLVIVVLHIRVQEKEAVCNVNPGNHVSLIIFYFPNLFQTCLYQMDEPALPGNLENWKFVLLVPLKVASLTTYHTTLRPLSLSHEFQNLSSYYGKQKKIRRYHSILHDTEFSLPSCEYTFKHTVTQFVRLHFCKL